MILSNYKFNNTFVNGKASFKVQKYNGEYEFSGNAELIDVTNESTSIDSIYIIYNGEYLDDIIDYNLDN